MKSPTPIVNVAYGDDPRQKLDVYPAATANAPTVLFWHGGSWKRGDKHTYRFVGRTLQRLGCTAVLPNYRFFPQVKFPAFNEDAASAVGWAHQNIQKFNGNPDGLFIMGHSAGAHIAVFTAYDDQWLKQAKVPISAVRGFIGLSGPYDFYPGKPYRPVFNMKDPSRPWNPIDHLDHLKLPALLLHGGLDLVVKSDNSKTLANYLNQHGGTANYKIYPYLDHMGVAAALSRPLAWLPLQREIKRFIEANR